MPKTTRINIFTNRSIAKNASIVLSTPINCGNFGPNTSFWFDLNASKPGQLTCSYQVGNTPDDTFYTPSDAENLCASHRGGATTGSRDRYIAYIYGTEWLKIKAKELNASNILIVSADLIVSQP